MVDDDGSGCYSFDEIKEICLLTFEIGDEDEDQGESTILKETADFQARTIFKLLKFDLDDEIPIDAFKHHIFHGNEETKKALRQFCCLDS